MPHAVRQDGQQWVVFRTDTGKVKSHHTSRQLAEKSLAYIQKNKAEKALKTIRGQIS